MSSASSLAKKILTQAEEAALKLASKAREASPDNTNAIWEALQARKNARLAEEAAKEAADVKAATMADELIPRSKADAPTEAELALKDSLAKSDKQAEIVERWTQAQDAEKANRSKAKIISSKNYVDEGTVALPDVVSDTTTTRLAAVAAPTFGGAFANPANVAKGVYDKFEQARASVVNKIVDLTGAPLLDNPHVPQYAKDTYSKAAEGLVDNATNPVNFVGGAGAADAAIGAASTAYGMTAPSKSTAPQVSYPGDKKVQQVKYRP